MKKCKCYIINIIIICAIFLVSGCEDNNSINKALTLFYISNGSSYKKCSIKEYPETITALNIKTSNEESQSTENSNETDDPSVLWKLFDSNTISSYTASTSHKFTINFGKTIALSRIKLFGSTTYTMNVYIDPDDDLVKIPSLCVDQSILKDRSWNTFSADEPVKTDSIVLEIIPNGDTGISELEFWSEKSVNVADGSLTNNLENITASENLKSAVEKNSNHVVEISALPNEISMSGSEEESVTAQMRISLSDNPIIYKRAYIQYKAKNILTPVSIERRINNYSWNGGYDVPTKEGTTPSTDWVEHFEEINPAWLIARDNTIEFRTNKSDVSIQNLTLVLVKDNGWNQVVAVSKPEAYDNDMATAGEIADASDTLDIEFERIIEPEAVMFSLANKSNARVSVQYLSNTQWLPIKNNWTIDLSEMNQGWNQIKLPAQVQTKALRLQIVASSQGTSESGAVTLNELRVCGSSVGDPDVQPRIIVSYPRNGEYYGRTAYIQGFVNSAYQAQIGVENNSASSPVQDNSFSLSLSKDTTRFSGQEDDAAWDPVANAVRWEYSISKSINLTNNKLSTSSGNSSGTNGGTTGGTTTSESDGYTTEVVPDSAKTITYGPITIEIPAGAVDEKITITIIPLSKNEVAALNPGMINVTYPAAGYRFLVNGKPHYNFRKPINISFTYSKNLLLQGQGDNDVFMYYYAESQKTWKRLQRINTTTNIMSAKSVSSKTKVVSPMKSVLSTSSEGVIVSQTDHFTDIINATITVPENPDPLLYNPNTIKDIKVGNPTEEVDLINQPVVNNKGEARLNYPIDIPSGRNGMQPAIAVQYNSSHQNGCLGVGWDIPIRTIAIDTTFGVPRYNGEENYLLEGEQIEFIGNSQYQQRVEGNFKKIIRHNSTCSTYWWEVFDKNGTRYIYGQNDVARLKSYRTPGNIFMWCLERIEDTNGNNITFHYFIDEYNENNEEPARQIYIDRINYTGTGVNDGPYLIVFQRESRLDKIINCRSGFKTYMRYRLRSISIIFKNNPVRSYDFNYDTGPFNKSRLLSIVHKGNDNSIFYNHTFEYYDDLTTKNNDGTISDKLRLQGFDNTFKTCDTAGGNNLSLKTLEKMDGSFNLINAYVGIGLAPDGVFESLDGVTKSVGKDLGVTNSKLEAKILLLDITGDILPDKIYYQKDLWHPQNTGIFYQKNLGYQNDEIQFDSPKKIEFLSNILDDLGYISEKTDISGARIYWNEYKAINDILETTSTTESYFSDVNGDGLIDFVNNKDNSNIIYYNNGLNSEGSLLFSNIPPSSFGSDTDKVDLSSVTIQTPTREELLKKYHRDDPILMWQAPYDGVVQISGDIRLIPQVDLRDGNIVYPHVDGVKVGVQINNTLLWSEDIPANNNDLVIPQNVDNIIVETNDRIYFRVNSREDGSYDCVSWNPVIEYKNVDTNCVDENNVFIYHYEPLSDFSFADSNIDAINLLNGVVNITGSLLKDSITSDDVTLILRREISPGINDDLYTQTIRGDETGIIEIPFPSSIDVNSSEKMICILKSDTPIDWSKLHFNPIISYASVDGVDSIVDENGRNLFTFELPVNMSLYPIQDKNPIMPYTVPQDRSGNVRIIYMANMLPTDPSMPNDYLANITLAVKRNGSLVYKQKGIITKTGSGDIIMDTTISVSSGDRLYFVCSSDKNDFTQYIHLGLPTLYYQSVNGIENGMIKTTTGVEAIAMVYRTRAEEELFSGGFRNWYYGRWNGEIDVFNPSLVNSPDLSEIPEFDQLTSSDIEHITESIKTFSPMNIITNTIFNDSIDDRVWGGIDKDCFIGRVHEPNNFNNQIFVLSSTRIIKKFIPYNSNILMSNISTRGVSKLAHITTKRPEIGADISTSCGGETICEDGYCDSWDSDGLCTDYVCTKPVTYHYICSNYSISNSSSYSITNLDFFDFNGDRYPDIVMDSGVQFTNPDGSLENSARHIDYFVNNENIGSSVNYGFSVGQVRTSTVPLLSSDTMYTSDFSLSSGMTSAKTRFVDINGDDLPDMVTAVNISDTDNQIRVRYNLGYGLGNEEILAEEDYIDHSNLSTFDGTVNIVNKNSLTQGTIIGGGSTRDDKIVEYIDVNGDGLPDWVERNLGNKNNLLMVRFNTGKGFTPDKYEWNSNLSSIIDIQNSVYGTTSITIFKSFTFNIPLFPLYKIVLNLAAGAGSYNNSSNTMFKDIDGDGYPDHVRAGEYGNINFNKNNTGRTNLLRKVILPFKGYYIIDYKIEGNTPEMPHAKWTISQLRINTEREEDQDNEIVTNFKYNGGYYDRKEREFYGFNEITETRPDESTLVNRFFNNNYYLKGFITDNELRDKDNRLYVSTHYNYGLREINNRINYPYLTNKTIAYHEGNNNSSKSTIQTYDYDGFGNVIKFIDNGDEGPDDDISATIAYMYNSTKYIMGKPNYIKVNSNLDGNGKEYRMRTCTYDNNGNLTVLRQFHDNGDVATTNIDYYPNGNLMTISGPTNQIGQRYYKAYTYDSETQSHIAKISDSFGYYSQTTYYPDFGKVHFYDDINHNTTEYIYDQYGRVKSIIGPTDDSGSPTILIDYFLDALQPYAKCQNNAYNEKGGRININTYIDGLGRMSKVVKDAEIRGVPGSVTVQYEYDEMGRIDKEIGPVSSNITEYTYDILGRKISVTFPDSTSIHYAYSFDNYNNNSYFTSVITDQNRNKKTFYRDIKGLIKAVDEGLGVKTEYDYNPMNEIVKIKEGGNSNSDGKNHSTIVTYDNFGRRTSIDNPDAGLMEISYDLAGNVISKVTPNLRSSGKAIRYAYEYNRLSLINYPDMHDVVITYGGSGEGGNRIGRIMRIDNGTVVENRTYDPLGNISEISRSINIALPASHLVDYTTSYSYDSFGRMRSITLPGDREIVKYTYDAGGLLKTIYSDTTPRYYYVKNINYNEYGQRESIEYGNGVITTYNYNTANRRLTNLLSKSSGGATLQNISYKEYDNVGNIKNIENNNFTTIGQEEKTTTQLFNYDTLYRLTYAEGTFVNGSSKNNYRNDFIYDIYNNMLSKTQQNTLTSGNNNPSILTDSSYSYGYTYHALKPHAVISTGEKAYSYDANGNMTDWVLNSNLGIRMHYNWDEENHLIQSIDNSRTTNYIYDNAGKRIIKRADDYEVVYVNDNYSVRNGSVVSKHIFAGNNRIATKIDMSGLDQSVYYYQGDHLGSSNVITNTDGSVHEHLEYFPYGETWVQETASSGQSLPYRFSSKELDDETGLYYFGARYYEPRLSRWISVDKAFEKYIPSQKYFNNDHIYSMDNEQDSYYELPGFGGVFNALNINAYQYGGLNPLKFIDPDGNVIKVWVMNDFYILPYRKAEQGHKGTPVIVGSSFFGMQYPAKGKSYFHNGVDSRPAVDRSIRKNYEQVAVAKGIVDEVTRSNGEKTGYGNSVVIFHGYDKDGNSIKTRYAHLDSIEDDIKKGEFVKKDQSLGRVGDTGLSYGDHSHYEILVNDKPISPKNEDVEKKVDVSAETYLDTYEGSSGY